jgi:ribonucleoside-diphosphate reductase alpha chain
MEWSDKDSYACCTLASINLKKFLVKNTDELSIDYDKLHEITRLVIRNLDNIIDNNSYPVPECERNSADYRPIGVGIQGLADVFAMMRIPFISD